MQQQALQNRSIVIIGGTSGLGLSAARACAEAGAYVTAVGLDAESVERAGVELGEAGLVFTGDATEPATAPRAINKAVERFGRFDGLYHVAGGSGRRYGDGPLHELTDEGIDHTLRLNLTSLIYSNRAAANAFLQRGHGGSVLNLTSVLAYAPSPEHFSTHAYAAAKSAVIGLTKSCAAAYAERNIRFNALAPGLTDTPMAKRAAADPTIMGYVSTKQPLDGGRIGRPEDLDAAVVYFLSDGSRFVTGQILGVDGGWAVSEGRNANAPYHEEHKGHEGHQEG